MSCCSTWYYSDPFPDTTGPLNRLHEIEKIAASIQGTDSTLSERAVDVHQNASGPLVELSKINLQLRLPFQL